MASALRTPAHLWVIGGVSALWNAVGPVDYVMTQTKNEAWLSQFTAEQRAYFDSFPAWSEAAWAFGVWGALVGSLLLLARSRHAVTAFAISLAGLFVTTIYQFFLADMPASLKSGGMLLMNLAIWAIAVALLLYAIRMRKRGVLR